MKRKDFLRKMRDRRRGGVVEERQPARRRAVDWRTLRVELPAEGDAEPEPQKLPVGELRLLQGGVQLDASDPCWVRGYRVWEDDGAMRAEFQYRPVEADKEPPPGAIALAAGETWKP